MKFKSLIPAFALAVSTLLGLEARGQNTPQQDTTNKPKVDTVYVRDTVYVPVPVSDNTETPDASERRFVTQQAIDEVAANGVDDVYYLAGIGFSQGVASTGENVGVEFRIYNGYAMPTRAFNLDNYEAATKFDDAKSRAEMRELDLALRHGTYVIPDNFLYRAPVTPIPILGWNIVYVVPGGPNGHNNGYNNNYNNGPYNNNGHNYNNGHYNNGQHHNNHNDGQYNNGYNNNHNHNNHGHHPRPRGGRR